MSERNPDAWRTAGQFLANGTMVTGAAYFLFFFAPSLKAWEKALQKNLYRGVRTSE